MFAKHTDTGLISGFLVWSPTLTPPPTPTALSLSLVEVLVLVNVPYVQLARTLHNTQRCKDDVYEETNYKRGGELRGGLHSHRRKTETSGSAACPPESSDFIFLIIYGI